jgi:hypothetical protein
MQIQEIDVRKRCCRVEELPTWPESRKIVMTSGMLPVLTIVRSSRGIVEAGFR